MFLGIVMHNIDYDTKENTIYTKDKSERQHIPLSLLPSRKIGILDHFFKGAEAEGFLLQTTSITCRFIPLVSDSTKNSGLYSILVLPIDCELWMISVFQP